MVGQLSAAPALYFYVVFPSRSCAGTAPTEEIAVSGSARCSSAGVHTTDMAMDGTRLTRETRRRERRGGTPKPGRTSEKVVGMFCRTQVNAPGDARGCRESGEGEGGRECRSLRPGLPGEDLSCTGECPGSGPRLLGESAPRHCMKSRKTAMLGLRFSGWHRSIRMRGTRTYACNQGRQSLPNTALTGPSRVA